MNDPYTPFQLVVTGSRNYKMNDMAFDKLMEQVFIHMAMARREIHIDQPNATLNIAEGGADGADARVREWVKRTDSDQITHKTFEADWTTHGLSAGPKRNALMLEEWKPELVLAIWDGKVAKSGTLDCMKKANDLGIPLFVVPARGIR